MIGLVTELGVAVFNTTQNVFSKLGFQTRTSSPTYAELAFIIDAVVKLDLRTSNTSSDVRQNRVHVVTKTGAERAFKALLNFQARSGRASCREVAQMS